MGYRPAIILTPTRCPRVIDIREGTGACGLMLKFTSYPPPHTHTCIPCNIHNRWSSYQLIINKSQVTGHRHTSTHHWCMAITTYDLNVNPHHISHHPHTCIRCNINNHGSLCQLIINKSLHVTQNMHTSTHKWHLQNISQQELTRWTSTHIISTIHTRAFRATSTTVKNYVSSSSRNHIMSHRILSHTLIDTQMITTEYFATRTYNLNIDPCYDASTVTHVHTFRAISTTVGHHVSS